MARGWILCCEDPEGNFYRCGDAGSIPHISEDPRDATVYSSHADAHADAVPPLRPRRLSDFLASD